MFRFNPGIERKTVPDYNPYTIRRCRDCDVAKGKLKLARFIPDNEVCKACRIIRECAEAREYSLDPKYGKRLRINKIADQSELKDNIRGAYSILSSFPETSMTIRPHIMADGIKNPEYTINELIADRKGIESLDGVSSGFTKATKQGVLRWFWTWICTKTRLPI